MEQQVLRSRFQKFMDIFPSYDVFKDFYISTPLSDNENDCPSEKTFTLISYEFNDNHSAFSDESFKQRFANVIYTYYREFEETSKEILKLLEVKDSEIAVDNLSITNIANIPEVPLATDAETVDFVSTQQKTIMKKGNLQIRKEQLTNKRTFTVKTFLNRFRHLFIKIISPAFLSVISEPDDL